MSTTERVLAALCVALDQWKPGEHVAFDTPLHVAWEALVESGYAKDGKLTEKGRALILRAMTGGAS